MHKTHHRFLLLSDLDDTLLGDDAALRRFHDYFQAHYAEDVALAYASGRFYDSIHWNVRTTELPEPQYVIGGVGSDLRPFPKGEPDREWIQRIAHDEANPSLKKPQSIMFSSPWTQRVPSMPDQKARIV